MKRNLFLISFVFLSFLHVSAQNLQKVSFDVHWNAIQRWSIGNSYREVISFENAVYPFSDFLPYFSYSSILPANKSLDFSIENATYLPLSIEEQEILPASYQLTEQPTLKKYISRKQSGKQVQVLISPFVKQSGKVLKLKSFNLVSVESSVSQKVNSATTLHSYAGNSVLKQGRFVKIKIKDSGVYKLTYEDLVAMGVTPADVRIFGYGGNVLNQDFTLPKKDDLPELPIYMEKGADGVFNAGDYVLFYANGINKWTFDESKSMFVHELNPYANYGCYFVSSDAGVGRRISDRTIYVPDGATIVPVNSFVDFQVYEKELINLGKTGKVFYGETFQSTTPLIIPFNFPNTLSGNSVRAHLDVASYATLASTFYLNLNDGVSNMVSIAKKTDKDEYERGKSGELVCSFVPDNDNLNFSISYNMPNSTAKGYLNFLEVNVDRQLSMSGAVMPFQHIENYATGLYNQYILSNAASSVQIWDITDTENVQNIPYQNDNGNKVFVDNTDEIKHYLAIDPTSASSFSKPEVVGVVDNQDLHALSNVDMVIISHPSFVSQANLLAQAHQNNDNLTVAVVTTEQVYNEFSSGTPDASAYRWMMKMLYDRADVSFKPKYLLLFGRGTYDNRKLLATSGDNLILTYQANYSLSEIISYVTDDYFALMENDEGLGYNDGSDIRDIPSSTMELGVGRFPVKTVEEASDVVSKTISYMENKKKGIWKNQLCFLADDEDNNLHMAQSDSLARATTRNFPNYQVNKIFLDSYFQETSASGNTYPLARIRLQELLRKGMLLFNYTGHAGTTGFTGESILTVNDVKEMTNSQLPLWVGATCNFLQFDAQAVSAGEQVVLNPIGGGIGILSSARPVYASQNFRLNKFFCDSLFAKVSNQHYRLGDVVKVAKNSVGVELNKLSYILLGDPALKLTYPTQYNIKTTQINNLPVTGNDTLRALAVVKIKGEIVDNNNQLVNSFNGKLQAVVYDKAQTITCLDNDKLFADPSFRFKYTDRPNTLFSGKVLVENGIFEITFMLPKDIKYNYGAGRINYYANDTIIGDEAQGNFESFLVGGTDANYLQESLGPIMSLYLNSLAFENGSQVNQYPVFIAKLSDQNGINMVGSGIGHDLLLTVDDDPSKTYVLNDYYESDVNTYQSGTVMYKIPTLEEGKHTLTFRAWDLLNNSTTQSLQFEVVNNLTPEIFFVKCYPNPAKSYTRIVVSHDRPESVLHTNIEIFDLSGRKVWSFEENSVEDIEWDLIGSDGKKVKAGLYLYKVSINTEGSGAFSKTNKLVVVD